MTLSYFALGGELIFMSGTNDSAGQVLGAATGIGGGIAVLPVTGGSFLGIVLPVTAIACGVIILASLAITKYLSSK